MRNDRGDKLLYIICLLVMIIIYSILTSQKKPAEAVAEPVPVIIEKTVEVEKVEYIDREIEKVYFPITEAERLYIEQTVEGEASGTDTIQKMLVSECILNTCELDGIRPIEAICQKQYSGFSEIVSEETKKAVSNVFDAGVKLCDKPIEYFYSTAYCYSGWHESLNFGYQHGPHRYFYS